MKNKVLVVAAGFAFVAILCWSGNFVMGRAVRSDIPPASLSFWRWVVASIVLLPVALSTSKQEWRAITKSWKVLTGLGLFGAALFQTMTYVGLTMIPATNALLLTAINPLIVILLARIILKEKTGLRQWFGIGVSFVGVCVLISGGRIDTFKNFSFNMGDLWVFGAVFAWGCYSILLKFRPINVRPMMVVFTTAITGAALVSPFYLLNIFQGNVFDVTRVTISAILYTGIFASVIAFICFNAAVARIGPTKASYFLHLLPVCGSILAYMFLGERFRGAPHDRIPDCLNRSADCEHRLM